MLAGWARLMAQHPRLVLVMVGLSVLGSIWVTLLGVNFPGIGKLGPLGFQSNRNDLISPRLDWNQRFINWQKGFPGTWDFIIVVDVGPDEPGRAEKVTAARAMIDQIGPALQKDPWVKRAVWGFDSNSVSPKAIRLETLDESKPTDDFRFWLQEMRSSADLIASASPQAFLASVLNQLQQTESAEDADETQAIAGLRQFAAVLNAFNTALRNDSDQPTDLDKLIRESQPATWNYLVSDNGRLYFLRVTPRHDEGSLNALEPAIASVRNIIADMQSRHPGVTMGMTGIDVVETDETAVVNFDSTWTGALTGLCMFGLLVMAFHSWRMPLMIMLSLGVAILWSFGFTTVFVGHLQVISIVFIPLLLGLGIAYGIYLASRFEWCVISMRTMHRDTRRRWWMSFRPWGRAY
ncbi:MAG: MMPL family transporter [Phycisphaerales bacterium]|nr:MMPL family transporter [Phycisphaerales bacterium]